MRIIARAFLLEPLAAALRIADQDFHRGEARRVELSSAVDFALAAVAELVEQDELVQRQVAAEQRELAVVGAREDQVPLVLGQSGRRGRRTVPPVRRLYGESIEDIGKVRTGLSRLIPLLPGDYPAFNQDLRKFRKW